MMFFSLKKLFMPGKSSPEVSNLAPNTHGSSNNQKEKLLVPTTNV